jgi:hypothetical protein
MIQFIKNLFIAPSAPIVISDDFMDSKSIVNMMQASKKTYNNIKKNLDYLGVII